MMRMNARESKKSFIENTRTLLIHMFRIVFFIFVLVLGLSATHAWAIETTTYYHHDALGSPVAATDDAGTLKWREDYKPYGERVRNPASDNKLWYTGKIEEPALGMQYFGARWYDPVIGRFTGIDPVAFQEGNIHSFNRYAYANNNPYVYVDPDGNRPDSTNFMYNYLLYNSKNGRSGYTSDEVWLNVGGWMAEKYGGPKSCDGHRCASCSVRGSIAINLAGERILSAEGTNLNSTDHGDFAGEGLRIIMNAGHMEQYLKDTWATRTKSHDGFGFAEKLDGLEDVDNFISRLKPNQVGVIVRPGHFAVFQANKKGNGTSYSDPHLRANPKGTGWVLPLSKTKEDTRE